MLTDNVNTYLESGVNPMLDMLRNIIVNLFSKPATRKYPYVKRDPFEKTRGYIDVEIDNCIFCGMCQRRCPSDAIKVDKENKTWEINNFKCIVCNVCAETCPKKCVTSNLFYKSPSCEKEVTKRKKEEQNDA